MTQPLESTRVGVAVVDAILAGRSTTISRDGSPLPRSGFYVGGKVPSLVLADPSWSLDAVAAWVESHRSDYVGVWLDPATGYVHVDLTDWVVGESYALGLARRRGELAIYDIRNQRDIKTGV